MTAPISTSNWPLGFISPESVGLCPQRLQRLEDTMQQFIDTQQCGGIVTLIARKGAIAHLQTYGQMDIDRQIPMRDDAIFRIFSMSKIITTVAFLMVYEQGRFMLDEPLSKYIPEFAKLKVKVVDDDGKESFVDPKREPTFNDLLTHTAGLTYDIYPQAREDNWTLDQFMEEFLKQPLISQPGEQWNYSASNDVMGYLVQKITGIEFAEFLDKHIFKPLGMKDTAFYVPADKKERLMTCYTRDDKGNLVDSEPISESPYLNEKHFQSGGGGLVSTTADYLAFAQMLLDGGEFNGERLLSRKTVELMRQNHLPTGHPPIDVNKRMYGYGVSVLTNLAMTQQIASVGEFGWGGAACTELWMDPQEQMISMFMTQYRSVPTDSKIQMMNRFKILAYQALV